MYIRAWELIHWALRPLRCRTLTSTRLGVKTRIFHLGDYRRATIPFGEDMPDDYFYVNGQCYISAFPDDRTKAFSSIGVICSSSTKDCEKMSRRHLPLFEP